MKKRLIHTLFCTAVLFASAACNGTGDEESIFNQFTRSGEEDKPVLTTDSIIYNWGSKATAWGTVTDEGGSKVRNRGMVFSYIVEEPQLGMDDCRMRRVAVDTLSAFKADLIALSLNKTYYVRSYAINETDTAYGNVLTLNTIEEQFVYPTITTLPVKNRTKVAAIAYGQFIEEGTAPISGFGICLSQSPNPTVKDTYITCPNKATAAGYVGQFGAFFDNLTPNTLYHIRSCVSANDSVIYGEDRIFRTTSGGYMRWGWSIYIEDSKNLYNTITNNVNESMNYYNNYSNLTKYEYINYSAGFNTTADANIEGWVRFCSQYSARTASHEFAHTLGVGTASNWDAVFNGSGQWSAGQVTNQTIRAMYKDQTLWIKKSGIHFWPAGLNYDSEYTSGETNNLGVTFRGPIVLKANSMVLNAMRIDGLTSY